MSRSQGQLRYLADRGCRPEEGAHDFRRIFTADAVSGGLPVHIAVKLLGHADLSATQIYVAHASAQDRLPQQDG